MIVTTDKALALLNYNHRRIIKYSSFKSSYKPPSNNYLLFNIKVNEVHQKPV